MISILIYNSPQQEQTRPSLDMLNVRLANSFLLFTEFGFKMAHNYSVFLGLHRDLKLWNSIYVKVSSTLIALEILDSDKLSITLKIVEDSCFSLNDAYFLV